MDDNNTVLAIIDGPGNERPRLIISQTITIVFAVLTVLLRFVSRRVSKTQFGLDDWILLPSLACALAVHGLFWWWISYGYGLYVGTVTVSRLRVGLMTVWIVQLIYPFLMAMVNFSVLALYWKIFNQRGARIYCTAVAILRVAWLVPTVVFTCLECSPTRAFWDKSPALPHSCPVDIKKLFLSGQIVNIVLDVATIALALVLCSRLKLSRINRILLCGVFASGLFVTAVSCIRLKVLLDPDLSLHSVLNANWNFIDLGMWTGIEINLAVISASLPCLRPLVSALIPESWVTSLRHSPSQPELYAVPRVPRQPRARTSGPGIGGVPGAWYRVSRMSTFGIGEAVVYKDPKHAASVSRARLGHSEDDLPIQDLNGQAMLRPPEPIMMYRPPSWAASLPLWGSAGSRYSRGAAARSESDTAEGSTVQHSPNSESGRGSPWPLKF